MVAGALRICPIRSSSGLAACTSGLSPRPRNARAASGIGSTSATRGTADRWYIPESGTPRLPGPGRGRAGRADGRKGSSVSAMAESPLLPANRPELHCQPREISWDVDGHAARILQLIPQLVRLIQFEVGVPRVIRNLARCHGHGYDRHAGQSLSHQITDFLGRGDLDLRREWLPPVFGGTTRP